MDPRISVLTRNKNSLFTCGNIMANQQLTLINGCLEEGWYKFIEFLPWKKGHCDVRIHFDKVSTMLLDNSNKNQKQNKILI